MLSNNFNFELVTNVISGANSINSVYQFLKEKNYKKIGLVLDNNLSQRVSLCASKITMSLIGK